MTYNKNIYTSFYNDCRLFFFFFKVFGGHMSFFGGHWYPCFGFLVTSLLGFKARVGCLIRIAEANVMYVPQDPPLVLHLPTSWRPARSQSCPHILLPAEVRYDCRLIHVLIVYTYLALECYFFPFCLCMSITS